MIIHRSPRAGGCFSFLFVFTIFFVFLNSFPFFHKARKKIERIFLLLKQKQKTYRKCFFFVKLKQGKRRLLKRHSKQKSLDIFFLIS